MQAPKILANDFRRQWAETAQDALAAVDCVGRGGWFILGEQVRLFETALAELWGQNHAVGVASGMDALEIALRVLGCGAGDRVLVSPISAFATALAVIRLGAIPVFVDCDDSGLMSLDRAEAALRSRADIRFMIPVHLFGHSLDLEHLRHLRDSFGVLMIEDCAQSVLASSRGNLTGTVGHMSATSFYPTKNLGALGDGGAVLTNDQGRAQAVCAYRDYGQTDKYVHVYPGYNSRLDELQAAVLRRAHLPRLSRWTARRREIAEAYEQGIESKHVRVCRAPAESDSCRHLFPVAVAPDAKQSLMSWLKGNGVSCGEHYPQPLMDQPIFRATAFETIDGCATAREFCRSEVSLPIHPYLTAEEVDRVILACNSWKP